MASEEDNFDIDIYGDGGDYQEEGQLSDGDEANREIETWGGCNHTLQGNGEAEGEVEPEGDGEDEDGYGRNCYNGNSNGHANETENGYRGEEYNDFYQEGKEEYTNGMSQKIDSVDSTALTSVPSLPKKNPQVQGLKRKLGADDRLVDPGATAAIMITELPWWVTDDDVRGWANQSECEDELEDLTFSEHKVNGKSKG